MNTPAAAASNRQLAAALSKAAELIRQGGTEQALGHCYALVEAYPDRPIALRYLGLALLQAQRYGEAERHLAEALSHEPASADLLNDLGVARLRQGALDEALDYFNRSLDIDPRHGDALGNLAALFTEKSQPARAQPYLQRLVAAQPLSGAAYAKVARNSLLLDNAEQAVRLGRRAVRLAPQLAEARLTLAEALESTGRFRQAKFQYLSVLGRNPRQVTALAQILSMKETKVDERHVREAQALLDSAALPAQASAQLHLALARYFDRHRHYDAAFGHLRSGNAISWKKQTFDSTLFRQAVDSIIDVFTDELLRSRSTHAAGRPRPIFILGMPRSGTTLVEQILASHSMVAAGGELSTITNLAAGMAHDGEPYPHGVRSRDSAGLSRLAAQYRKKLESISADAAHVTDKMPFNFMHLGLISVLFPDAAIIHCRRDPLDTCLSCYFTSFGERLLFASDLEALGHYYLDYRRLMAHWHAVLPQRILDVHYEDLVSDTEQTIRTLLDWCGLDWEQDCLQFYRTDRGIRTPSRWQVRQPIYHRSVGRWRDYEAHLQPLVEILAPALRSHDSRQAPQG
ncbi:MAG: sulfotransferase [Gammaproteobacteria bacterium]|nr:sulfotransferase [Gammaproteobacteria bacterium]